MQANLARLISGAEIVELSACSVRRNRHKRRLRGRHNGQGGGWGVGLVGRKGSGQSKGWRAGGRRNGHVNGWAAGLRHAAENIRVQLGDATDSLGDAYLESQECPSTAASTIGGDDGGDLDSI